MIQLRYFFKSHRLSEKNQHGNPSFLDPSVIYFFASVENLFYVIITNYHYFDFLFLKNIYFVCCFVV